MTKTFPNLRKKQVSKYRKHSGSQSKMRPNRPTLKYIIIKMEKDRYRENLKGNKRKIESYIREPTYQLIYL